MQSGSVFDPAVLLGNMEVDGEMSVVSTPVPTGEYIGVTMDKYEIKKITPSDTSAEPFVTFELGISLDGSMATPDGQTIKAHTGRDKNIVRYKCFIDMTPAGGLDLGKGMNVGLGKLRAALGQNTPGVPWKFAYLCNQPIKVVVGHTVDKKDASKIYAEARSVLPVT